VRHLPNLLTLSRLVLAPFAVSAILAGRFAEALALFVVAGITDAADGWLARALHSTSRAGAYLDPIADKALLSAGFLALGIAGAVPWWLVAIVFGRDLLILMLVGSALLFTGYREFPPSGAGKISTVVQVVTGAVVIVDRAVPGWPLPPEPLFWVTAAAAIWSGAGYLRRAIRLAAVRSKPIGADERRCS
jgi:cardiolipin synthase